MKTRFFIIAFLYVCGAHSQTVIPEWFEELPALPAFTRFFVGYSGKHIDRAWAREAAIYQATEDIFSPTKTF